jgi:hypothetical protein
MAATTSPREAMAGENAIKLIARIIFSRILSPYFPPGAQRRIVGGKSALVWLGLVLKAVNHAGGQGSGDSHSTQACTWPDVPKDFTNELRFCRHINDLSRTVITRELLGGVAGLI